jgi:hypothetical protein
VSFYGLAFATLASLGAVVSGIALTKVICGAAAISAGITDLSGRLSAYFAGSLFYLDA